MKYLIILACLAASTIAQRPSFAGIFPKGPQYADVHNNFRVNTTSTSAAPAIQVAGTGTNLADRVGETDTTTIRLPLEAGGNANVYQWLQKWPQGNKPFWLLNAEHLDKHRHPEGSGNTVVAVPNTANRNNFENTYTLEDFLADIDREEYEKFNKNALQQLNPDYYSEFNNRNSLPQFIRNDEQPRQQRLNDNYDHIRQLKSGRRIF